MSHPRGGRQPGCPHLCALSISSVVSELLRMAMGRTLCALLVGAVLLGLHPATAQTAYQSVVSGEGAAWRPYQRDVCGL